MNNRPYYGAPGPGPVYTQEFIEVLASTDLQAKLPGGVLLAQGNGVVKKGTVLGKVTATQKYVPYDADASDGSQVAVCILDNIAIRLRLTLARLHGLQASSQRTN
ncbi:head decoration protein [Paenibacillus cellulosilyticus]|uniref:head decoration protein n=1 Tax=Paenibacillus cellulosilyticus TaxID=375489 RepID=UPI001FF073DC|nr:head decoration protein [Paenibacillus cellulosilyticus]